ncbi:MAG TPA: hypothetical protein PKB00_01690 [Microthrixaceae bacterium]|nr:hypothetical protein [Microthrixaceae bacterium]
MTAPVSIADYEDLTGLTVAGTDSEARVQSLLDRAWDAVLTAAAGQAIASTTYTDVTLIPYEGVIYFPQRPVTDVASVSFAGEELTEGSDYRWTPGGNGRPAKLIRRFGGIDSYWQTIAGFPGVASPPADVVVTYTAGWETVPAILAGIVVAVTRAAFDNGGSDGVVSESAGPFSVTYEAPRSGAMRLTDADKAEIAAVCGVRGPSSVPIVWSP